MIRSRQLSVHMITFSYSYASITRHMMHFKTSKALVDNFNAYRLFNPMKTPTSAAALRVARTLLGLSQRDAAEKAGISQRAITQAEDPTSERLAVNLTLVAFYRARGIEFLGETTFGEKPCRDGARLAPPEKTDSATQNPEEDRSASIGMSYRAARALVNILQTDVSSALNLSRNAIAQLEASVVWEEDHDRLKSFYEEKGVEFLGWGQVGTNKFLGVGVRRTAEAPEDGENPQPK